MAQEKKSARYGFSTGTASSAAAKVAVAMLFGALRPKSIEVTLPPFLPHIPEKKRPKSGEQSLLIPVLDGEVLALYTANDKALFFERFPFLQKDWFAPQGSLAWGLIEKDGGDDPDATHKAHIYAFASCAPFQAQHHHSWLRPLLLQSTPYTISLYAGAGIGHVSLAGLPVLIGEPAINPAPRAQISFAIQNAMECKQTQQIHVLLAVANGEEIAKKTLNPRLGILGGISILGTQGTVKPYSHQAWKCTIRQGLELASNQNKQYIALTTGRRSERLILEHMPDLDESACIQAADFAHFSLCAATKKEIPHIVWSCFFGKLVKLAQGLRYTHAKSKAIDKDMLQKTCEELGVSQDICEQIPLLPTAQGVLELLEEKEPQKKQAFVAAIANKAFAVLVSWRDAAQKKQKKKSLLHLRVFAADEELLFRLDEEKA